MNTNREPFVSVVVPNYNDAENLRHLIECCQKQSLKPKEIIIVEDASTDHSKKVIEALCKANASIRVIYHSRNMGVIRSFNEGAKYASGDYLALRSANDIVLPGFFQTAVKYLNMYKEAALACFNIAFFTENPSKPQKEDLDLCDRPIYIDPDRLCGLLTEEHFLHGASILLRREAFISIGGYSESCRWYADWVAHLRMAFRNGIVYIPQIGGLYCHNSDSYSNSLENRRKYQHFALKGVLEEIEKESTEVRTRFALSGMLGFLGHSLYETFIQEHRFHNIETLLLVERNRHSWHRIKDNNCRSTSPLSHLLRRRLNLLLPGIVKAISHILSPTIYFYGAGNHSHVLLDVWRKLKLVEPKGFLITKSSEGKISYWEDKPVYGVDDESFTLPDLIVLSSKSYEADMAKNVELRFQNVWVVSFYEHSFTRLPV